jgi:hypothetical protein
MHLSIRHLSTCTTLNLYARDLLLALSNVKLPQRACAFFLDPIYLQTAIIHSENGGRLRESEQYFILKSGSLWDMNLL